MSAVTDMPKATGNQKREEWKAATSPAVAAYYERRKKAAKMQAEREARKGQPITEAEYLATKARAGRPPKYRPEYCETVIKLSKEGLSLTAIAGKIGVTRDTIWDWGQKHPAFSNALKIAKPIRTAALEESMLAEDSGPRINARIFALKNAAPEEWSDRQNIEINQTVNVAVTFSNVLDGLCGKVIEGVLQDETVTQSNDINRLLPQTHDAGFETGLIETGLLRSGLVETGLDSVTETGGRLPPTADHLEPVDIEYTSAPSTQTSSSSPQKKSKTKSRKNSALSEAMRESWRRRKEALRTRSDVEPSDSGLSS